MFRVLQIPAFRVLGFTDSGFSCSGFYRFRLFVFRVLQIPAFRVPGFTDSGFSCSGFYRFRLFVFRVLQIPAFRVAGFTEVVLDCQFGVGSDVTTGSDDTGSDVIPHFPVDFRRFSLTAPEVTSL